MNDKYLILNRIKIYCEENNITQLDFIQSLEMTSAGFYKAIKKNTLSVEKLNKIAALLGISLSDLFNEAPEINQVQESGTGYQKRPIYIEDRLTNIENKLNLLTDAIQRQITDTNK